MQFLEITKSKVRRKLLSYFFTNPDSKLYLREIAAILKEDPGNLSKELTSLGSEGIFDSESRGNQKYFFLNKEYPLYKELESIIFKTIGIEGTIKDFLGKISGVKIAFIYGSFAKSSQNGHSDIDLAIIGDIDEDKLLEEINQAQEKLGREINYTLYSRSDWGRMKKTKDMFVSNIIDEPKIMLIGSDNEL